MQDQLCSNCHHPQNYCNSLWRASWTPPSLCTQPQHILGTVLRMKLSETECLFLSSEASVGFSWHSEWKVKFFQWLGTPYLIKFMATFLISSPTSPPPWHSSDATISAVPQIKQVCCHPSVFVCDGSSAWNASPADFQITTFLPSLGFVLMSPCETFSNQAMWADNHLALLALPLLLVFSTTLIIIW